MLSACLVASFLACSKQHPIEPEIDPASSWAVVPNSVAMAVGDTVVFNIYFFHSGDTLDVRDLLHDASVGSSEWYCDSLVTPCMLNKGWVRRAADFRSLQFTTVAALPGSVKLWLDYADVDFVGCYVHPPDCYEFVYLLPQIEVPVVITQ